MVIIMLLAERKNNCYCEHIVVGVFGVVIICLYDWYCSGCSNSAR